MQLVCILSSAFFELEPFHRSHLLPTQPLSLLRCLPYELQAYEYMHVVVMSNENVPDRKSTRLNSSHVRISYAVFCLKKKKQKKNQEKKYKKTQTTRIKRSKKLLITHIHLYSNNYTVLYACMTH